MQIALTEAQAIHPVFVFLFGMALVFFGLICIILICSIMGVVCKRTVKTSTVAPAEATPSSVPAPVTGTVIKNRGEFVAAVSAAIGEDLGEDISGFRIKSIKKK